MITLAKGLRTMLIEHAHEVTPAQARVFEDVLLEGEGVRFECYERADSPAVYLGYIVMTDRQRALLVEGAIAPRSLIWLRREVLAGVGPGAEHMDLGALAVRLGEQTERAKTMLDAVPSPEAQQLRQLIATLTAAQYAVLAIVIPAFGLELLSMPQSRLDGLHVLTDRILKAAGLAIQQGRPILATDLAPAPPTEQNPPTPGSAS